MVFKTADVSITFTLKQCQPDHWKNGSSAAVRKIVESLLLQSERETQWVGNRRLSRTVVHCPSHRLYVGNQKLVLHVVVGVEPLPSGHEERSLHAPTAIRLVVEPDTRTNGFGYCKLKVLYSPRT